MNNIELRNQLINYAKKLLNEDVELGKNGNFIHKLDDDFKPKEKLNLDDFKKVKYDKNNKKELNKMIIDQTLIHTPDDEFTDDFNTYIWLDDNKIVAILSVLKNDPKLINSYKYFGRVFINYVEITKDFRGHGLSEQLLDEAKKMGGNTLGVDKKNEVAIKVYKKAGFVIYAEYPWRKSQYMMVLKGTAPKENPFEKYKEE